MPNQSDEARRQEIHYSGRVQGVGFRYTTLRIARRFDVRGYVKNLHDGRVLLVVEGAAETVEAFVAAVEAEMGSCIRHREIDTSAASHEYTHFEIRR